MGIFSFGRGWGNLWPRRSTRPVQVNQGEPTGTRSQVHVTAETALAVPVVLSAARVIAEGMAQIPLKLYLEADTEFGGSIRQPQRDHELYDLLSDQPNDWMTSFEFRETLTLHAVLAGNGFAYINRGSLGRKVHELIPLAPDDVKVIVEPDQTVRYEVRLDAKTFTKVDRNQMLHLKGPSWDGAVGLNIMSLAREAVGLAVNLERSQADLFGKGGRPSGILSTEASIGPEAVAMMRARFAERFGPGGEGGIAVLDKNWKFESVSLSGVDNQQLESRKFQIEEICRALRVYPQMVMAQDKASTFASAGAFFQAHKTHTLMPWIKRWEGALKRDLIGKTGANKDIYARLLVDGLMEGDPVARSEYFAKMITNGVLSPNEVRAIEDRNPRKGGDEFLTPLNFRVGNEPTQPLPPVASQDETQITDAA